MYWKYHMYSQCVLRCCSSAANGVSSKPVSVLTIVNLSVTVARPLSSPPREVL